jgi:hypothetical protein
VNGIRDDNIVGIQTMDGEKFQLKREEAIEFKTLENLIEDAGTDEYIPLLNIDSKTFQKIRDIQTSTAYMRTLDDGMFFTAFDAVAYLDHVELMAVFRGQLQSRLFAIASRLKPTEVSLENFPYFRKYRNYLLENVFQIAYNTNNVAAITLLIESGVNPAWSNNAAISFASSMNHVGLVKKLLADNRVDPTASGNNAIRMASSKGHTEIVKLLLADRRVDPTAGDNFPVRLASFNGHTEIVKLLLATNRVDPTAGDD